MPMIKCKMCGGDLNLIEGSTVCECEYCGTKQTVPSADNEKKLTLFSRAGRLLRACEFDKAAGVFETIVADFPQEAEAYWGLVLCKYGIEYVDDPATGKKIPTCHRSSFDNVLDDANFEQACENTDAVARRVYRDEARQIEALRQAILQVSGKEEPYDVFISYKETDEHGERTLDSVIAQDIYKELTNEGYRVFFSRISLEDKLGTEYEPYIFAALNSAKVMLVVGTDYENFDAVWVKNEWSRFLKLIAKGEKKTLIPVFKNMDAYDMPKEFAKLAAQDMGKVGAMQDLVRGVEKIVGMENKQLVKETVVFNNSPSLGIAPLLKRVALLLEDSNWNRAHELCEQVLNSDPENAQAYVYELMCDMQVPVQTELCSCPQSFEENKNYQKAIRFADPGLKNELQKYTTTIQQRNEMDRKNRIYDFASENLGYGSYQEAADLFQSISGWRDADDKKTEALRKADLARKKALYDKAVDISKKEDSKSLIEAIDILSGISGLKLVDKKVEELTNLLQIVKKKEEEAEAKRLRLEALQRQYNEKFQEHLTLINDRDTLADKCRLAKDCLAQEKGKPWLLILLGLLEFLAGIWMREELVFIAIMEFLGGVLAIGLGAWLWSQKIERKASLKTEIKECEKKLEILKDIPTLEEYIKAHEE